jgi:hypothetical protein
MRENDWENSVYPRSEKDAPRQYYEKANKINVYGARESE